MRGARTKLCYLFAIACLLLGTCVSWLLQGQNPPATVTLFEGARLITGDGSAPIENSAFIVENNVFTRVGRRGELQVPPGAARVVLTGKTVMPTIVDLHGHFGFQHVVEGTMSKAFYTRENLIDHLERLAYDGVSAVVGIGDLVDRSDLHGGRTNWETCHCACEKKSSPTPRYFARVDRESHGQVRARMATRPESTCHIQSQRWKRPAPPFKITSA